MSTENIYTYISELNILNSLLITTCIALISCYIQWRFKHAHFYNLAAKLPPPNCIKLPLLGHGLYLAGDPEVVTKNVYKFCDSADTCAVWLGHKLFVTVTTPNDIEILLNSPTCLAKDDVYKFMEPFVGQGLFTAPVQKWKKHRKIVMPTFNQRILDQFVDVFAAQSKVLVDLLEAEVGHFFDIFEYVGRCTLDIVCETAMGIKVDAQTTDCEYAHRINRAMEVLMMRMTNVFYHSDFIFNLTSLSREVLQLKAEHEEFTNNVIIDKKEEYKNSLSDLADKPEAQIGEAPTRKAFLDLLIELSEAGANFSDEELRDEVNTFMIAGSDTSATVNAFVMVMLGMHQEIQQKVYEEVIDILGEERCPEFTDLPNFKYMEMVIKETMRLFPIGPLILRKVEADIQLENYMLPAGCGVAIVAGWTMRSEKYYENPLTFIPERFIPEEIFKRHPYSYLPFSGGPRNCIGFKYGMMAMKVLLATVVRRYKLETDYKSISDIRFKQAIVIKPVLGYPIRLTNR